ncbi:2Fe-2S iron-sulfur cluster binding domain-containing protein [Aquisediminimonas sediminicola]|uniref:2Fe-2S iron-sulfur cluster binding domain-containing protein n=1 Tax=Alteraquisediminimonas sediminicola TaxID=2676787 RepID=UPI001C8EF92D|nr:2Fe-2S iron-sulfur cluster-binding protein [Aquisediminimonas sediminicola]
MKIIVSVPGDGEVNIDARNGWTVMEAMRDAGLPIIAQCGGGRACATCHIHVDSAFFGKLTPMEEEEHELLESLDSFDTAKSRLSCQILCDDSLDGLTIALQPDSVGD